MAENARLDAHNVPHGRNTGISLVGEQVDIVVLVSHHNVMLKSSVLDRDLDDIAADRSDRDGAGSKTRFDMADEFVSIAINFIPSFSLTYSCRPNR